VHGMPRIGSKRELKWALEDYWAGRTSDVALQMVAVAIRRRNWQLMADADVDFVPSNDFSLYDHVLDAAVAVGAVPGRFGPPGQTVDLDRYFAMARGVQVTGMAVAPLELTKWFDTNYHQLVPEVGPDTTFAANPSKAVGELVEAASLGISTTPVLLGPFTFLARSTSEVPGFDRLSLLGRLVEVYVEILAELGAAGAEWVRLDEPALVEDRSPGELEAFRRVYRRLGAASARPRIAISTFFGHVGEAMEVLADLPVEGIGLDFCRGKENLSLLEHVGGIGDRVLFAGVVDGRNVWVNDLDTSLALVEQLGSLCGEVVVSTSCSLLHVPVSMAAETGIDPEVRPWLAFATEKLAELSVLAKATEHGRDSVAEELATNREALAARQRSPKVSDPVARQSLANAPHNPRRAGTPAERAAAQEERLGLPPLPTTTIGSFPQTTGLRAARASWRAGRTTDEEYRQALRSEIARVVALQEDLGLDVVVHGEPERDDMVRYFAAELSGFALPEEGWVQSYGSRCVRPPVLFGDVVRPAPITIEWTGYASTLTAKPVKGMLTGPVTMLCWSFVRDDLYLGDVAAQLGLAMRDEVADIQRAGASIIQIDEPALREGLPLRRSAQPEYLAWATRAFRLASSAAISSTQVHTHMCYAELADVLDVLAELDVDVASFEAARSGMALLAGLGHARYQGGVGPGVYDVHSPRVPAVAEIATLLRRAAEVVDPGRLWVNPDCGLKTRHYEETTEALAHMVTAARTVRAELASTVPASTPERPRP